MKTQLKGDCLSLLISQVLGNQSQRQSCCFSHPFSTFIFNKHRVQILLLWTRRRIKIPFALCFGIDAYQPEHSRSSVSTNSAMASNIMALSKMTMEAFPTEPASTYWLVLLRMEEAEPPSLILFPQATTIRPNGALATQTSTFV